jgi:hypothetical protein
MPAWLTLVLIKIVLPAVLTELVKMGFLDAAEKLAIKYGVDFVKFMASLKAQGIYPTDKNGKFDQQAPAVTNLVVKQP